MSLEFSYDLLSQPCRAVWLFMKAAGIKFKSKEVDLLKGENRTPEFLKKNPKGQVPFLDDNGFVVTESTVMVSYLAQKYKVAENWYPRSDLQRQTRINEFLHWHQLTIRKHEVGIFLNTFKSKVPFGSGPTTPIDQELVNSLKADLANSLKVMDEYFLKDQPFIGGKEISAADVFGICELYQLTGVGEEDLYERYPKLKAWADRVIEKLQPHFGEACKKINGLGQKFKAAA